MIESTETIKNIAKAMAENNITSVPVLDEGIIKGFVSEKSIVNLVANNSDESGTIFEATSVKDIDLDPIYGDEADIYGYVDSKTTIYDIEYLFSESVKNDQRLMALIVTHSGDHKQKPLGIITAWDLHR